jgi:hypothetical protein
MNFTVSWHSASQVPVESHISLDPVAFLLKANQRLHRRPDDGHWRIGDDQDLTLSVDGISGRLDPVKGADQSLSFSPHALELLADALRSGAPGPRSGEDPHPYEALGRLAVDALLTCPAWGREPGKGLDERTWGRLARPLRSLDRSIGLEEGWKFMVPDTTGKEDATAIYVRIVGGVVVGLLQSMVPADSWPVALAREAVLVVQGRGIHANETLRLLWADPRVGPIGCLAIASLLQRVDAKAAAAFADHGLSVASSDGFLADVALLGPILDEAVDEIAAIEDVDGVVASVSPVFQGGLSMVMLRVRELRRERGRSDAWRQSAREMWDAGLGATVRERLRAIAGADTTVP